MTPEQASQLTRFERCTVAALEQYESEADAQAAQADDAKERKFFAARGNACRKALFYYLAGVRPQPSGSDWLVPSGTRGGLIHRVRQSAGCTCEAGVKHSSCWHEALADACDIAAAGVDLPIDQILAGVATVGADEIEAAALTATDDDGLAAQLAALADLPTDDGDYDPQAPSDSDAWLDADDVQAAADRGENWAGDLLQYRERRQALADQIARRRSDLDTTDWY